MYLIPQNFKEYGFNRPVEERLITALSFIEMRGWHLSKELLFKMLALTKSSQVYRDKFAEVIANGSTIEVRDLARYVGYDLHSPSNEDHLRVDVDNAIHGLDSALGIRSYYHDTPKTTVTVHQAMKESVRVCIQKDEDEEWFTLTSYYFDGEGIGTMSDVRDRPEKWKALLTDSSGNESELSLRDIQTLNEEGLVAFVVESPLVII